MPKEKTTRKIKSYKEQVYEHLREQMRSGDLKPGAIIDMDETSKKFGISKTPLRDALLQLEMEKFVTILPRREVVVNALTLEDIKDLYEILGSLESTAILLGLDRLTGEDFDYMEKMIYAMSKGIAKGDWAFYYEKNLLFHGRYLDACGNPTLIEIVDLLKKRLYDFPRLSKVIREWEESSNKEHSKLLDLLRKGKKQEAAVYIRDIHWSFKEQEEYLKRFFAHSDSSLK